MKEKLKILIVDDNESNLYTLEAVLLDMNENNEIIKARNGDEALTCAQENDHFDLGIFDYQMPKINGMELSKMFMESNKHKNVPIIFLTAHSNATWKKLDGMGRFNYLPKPINTSDLEERIRKLINPH